MGGTKWDADKVQGICVDAEDYLADLRELNGEAGSAIKMHDAPMSMCIEDVKDEVAITKSDFNMDEFVDGSKSDTTKIVNISEGQFEGSEGVCCRDKKDERYSNGVVEISTKTGEKIVYLIDSESNYNDDVNPAVAETVAKLVDASKVIELEKIDFDKLPKRYAYHFIKRTFNIVSCSCTLVICVIPIAVIAYKIKKSSPGPVFYKQERLGLNGKPITIVKFRSMYIDAEKRGAQWAQEDDPRVTPIGKKIRANRLASVIIGTPGDGESTKSLSRSANSSLELQLCERRSGPCCFASNHYKRFQFLPEADFGDIRGVLNHAFARISSFTPSASFRDFAEGLYLSFSSILKAVRCNDGGECCRGVA